MDELLDIQNLKVCFSVDGVEVRAVDGVDLKIHNRETIALIGESGSGKSVLGLSILKLLPENASISGKILLDGMNIVELPEDEMVGIRGKVISWVPQNPSTSLNPVLKVGFQVTEAMETHGVEKLMALRRALSLFKLFDINPPNQRFKEYPHNLSGGMKQRVLVSMGISTDPKLIIADEPTKCVDAIRKTLVARLFEKVREKSSLLLITHDLEFAEKLADRVAVMYCGQIVEIREARKFFTEPLHPYSKALLDSLPRRGMKPIKGQSPSMVNAPSGCRFRDRCHFAEKSCRVEPPMQNGVRCWLYA